MRFPLALLVVPFVLTSFAPAGTTSGTPPEIHQVCDTPHGNPCDIPHGNPCVTPGGNFHDAHTHCLADARFPIEVGIDGPLVASPLTSSTAEIRVELRQPAERVLMELAPTSPSVSLLSTESIEIGPMGEGVSWTGQVAARLSSPEERGTIDIVVTAWFEGRPVSRGATWNLVPSEPDPGRTVERNGKLPVREHRVGRIER